MPVVTRRELLEAGVHFGHQTRRWNPKMKPFLFGERSGIYLIDLEQSLAGLEETHAFVQALGRRRGIVLFIGTKKQAQEVVSEHATRIGMPYINNRWLGGMLTNFATIKGRLLRLRELVEMDETGAMDRLPKKEAIRLRHEREKLERNLGGIAGLERLPDAVFVVDTKKEHIAVTEARKLGIPVIAIVDTNCDPDEVDFVIPGNDDAIRAVNLVTRVIADALAEGYGMAKEEVAENLAARAPRKPGGPKPQAAPAAVDDTPSDEEAAAIAISTVFEPDAPEAEVVEDEIVIEAAAEAETPEGPVEVVEETIVDVVPEAAPAGLRRGELMAEITAEMVKVLRDATGAGMMDCKRALIESDGDTARATEILREKGLASVAKRAGRSADQGLIDAYIHFNNTVGVLVEVNCETDFVANTDEFRQLVKDLALHIASPSAPRWLSRDDVPTSVLEFEQKIAEGQAKEAGKPENIVPKIVEGKIEAFLKDNVLVDQPFVKDDSKTIQQYLDEVSAKTGEKVQVRRFARFKLGEEAE